jgi:hypothetical protein
MMKRKLFALAVIFAAILAYAQLINVNPDPKGEEWIAGGFKVPAGFDRNKINFIDPAIVKTKVLPSRVDNSLHKFFRPVFNQTGGSCSQAAGIGYTFTYEMDRLRDLDASLIENQYPTHFTYNFLNEGSGEVGSWWGDGWDIIKSVGVMNVVDYGGHFSTGGNSRWISGINEWKNGHGNRVESYNAIECGTPEGLNTLKNWLDNHLEGSPYGGLAVFAAGATGYHERYLPEGTHEAGKRVITKWGPDVNHAMTYIGYDDSIRFDYNNDGRFTNDIDINGDRIVDMRDWEIGGLIVANSWGESFGDAGKIYQMYKLLAEPYENGGIFYSFADVVFPAAVTSPRFTLEIKMKHEQRNAYKISTGVNGRIDQTAPQSYTYYPYMQYQGGAFYPRGGRTETDKYIDFSMDISNSLPDIDAEQPFRFFFIIDENDPGNKYDGEIISAVVVDNFSGRRYYDTSDPTAISNNTRTTVSILVDRNTFVPENVSAFGGDRIVRLDWTGLETKVTSFQHYNIYKNGDLYASEITGKSFTDEAVENGTLYTYRISAVFSGTYSGEIFSFPVQAMPCVPYTLPYSIDFESGYAGWSLKNDLLTGWIMGDQSQSSEFCDYSGNGTKFLLANPDLAGDGSIVRDYAVTPVFNISSYDGVRLDFDYILNNYSELYYYCDISVMYRTGLDQPWILLEELSDSPDWTHKTIDIPYSAISSNSTQFAFFFDDHYQWAMGGGAFDNFSVTGTFKTYAPVITAFTPEDLSVVLDSSSPVYFSITVEDPDNGMNSLDIKWYVNGDLYQSGGDGFSIPFEKAGVYEIIAVVSDGYDEDSVTWSVTQTGISENIPVSTRLYNNYPNPFNPSTVIMFDIASDKFASLNIYNSYGQIVRSLVGSKLQPGSYKIVWDGKDEHGSALSSGIYYYTLRSENYSKTNKMLMFK